MFNERLADWLTGWLANRLINMTDWLTDWLTNWLSNLVLSIELITQIGRNKELLALKLFTVANLRYQLSW